MEKKMLLLWVGVGLLGLAVLSGGLFWFKGEKGGQSTSIDESITGTLVGGDAKEVMVEERRSAHIDDITTSIVADLAEDESALSSEEAAEINDVESGGNIITELGTSYDESDY